MTHLAQALPDWPSIIVSVLAATVAAVYVWLWLAARWEDDELVAGDNHAASGGSPTGQSPSKRHATPAELAREDQSVLQDLADGQLGATETTVLRARVELEERRHDNRVAGKLQESLGRDARHLYLVERGRS